MKWGKNIYWSIRNKKKKGKQKIKNKEKV